MFAVSLTLRSDTQLQFELKEGPFARTEVVDIQVVPLGNGIFAVSWQEASGATVTNIQDYDRGLIHSFAKCQCWTPRRGPIKLDEQQYR